MWYEKQNIGEIYATRAMTELEQPAPAISIPRIREPRDMVYNGTMGTMGTRGTRGTISTPSDEVTTADKVQPLRSRKHGKRKVSPFTIVLILLCSAVASVLYIGNILAVGQLMAQINQLQTKHQQMLNRQELLKAQINRLSGIERIQQLAHDQLGLQNPKQFPVWIEIDPERLQQVEEMIQQQVKRRR